MLRYDLEDFSCEKLVRSVFFVDLYNCETNYYLSEHISDLPIGSSFNGVNPEKRPNVGQFHIFTWGKKSLSTINKA